MSLPEFELDLQITKHTRSQTRRYLWILLIIMAMLALIALAWASVFPAQSTSDIHAVIEILGSLIGLMAGISLVAQFYVLGDRFNLIVGLAYLVNGVEDFFHGLFSFRNFMQLSQSSLAQFVPATYVTGRILLALLLIAAPWLRNRFGKSSKPKQETFIVSISIVLLTGALTTGVYFLPLPVFMYPEMIISRPVDFISAILLIVALLVEFREYWQSKESLVWWILLSIVINIVGQFVMSFSSMLYDPFFIVAHLYKLLAIS